MLGGHLDSWHSATGATDNAIGCAIMMEAARILKAIGVKPRRTIRVALWSGEEEGLLGSQAYVKEHFGSFENPKPEFAKLDAYLNIDSGTGRARGAGVFGPPAAAAILRQTLAPFADLGVVGASATAQPRDRRHRQHVVQQRRAARHRLRPGSHRIQHPHAPHEPRQLRAHHRRATSRTRPSSSRPTLYQLAMRDEMVPRFAPSDMPPPVPRNSSAQDLN